MFRVSSSGRSSFAILAAAAGSSLLLIALMIYLGYPGKDSNRLAADLEFFIQIVLPLVGIGCCFLGVMAWSAVHACRDWHQRRFIACLPLLVQLAALLLAVLVPWRGLLIDLDFRYHLKQREEVIRKINSGELRPQGVPFLREIKLPEQYAHLSHSGLVNIRGDFVYFKIAQGFLTENLGFLYSKSDAIPTRILLWGEIKDCQRKAPHWFWVRFQ